MPQTMTEGWGAQFHSRAHRHGKAQSDLYPNLSYINRRGTMTTKSNRNGATTLFRINFSGYVGHVSIFSWMLTITYCLVVGLGSGLVSG